MADKDIRDQVGQSGEEVREIEGNKTGETGEDGMRDNAEATLQDPELEIAGGKLPGNHDDFEGELDERVHPVPGADKQHHPAHAMNKGETKHLGI
jgi:hypothetical protein